MEFSMATCLVTGRCKLGNESERGKPRLTADRTSVTPGAIGMLRIGWHGSLIRRTSHLLPLLHIHWPEQQSSDREEQDHRQDGIPARAGGGDGTGIDQGPEDPGELLEYTEEAEKLPRLVAGDQNPEQRAAEGLGGAPNQSGQAGPPKKKRGGVFFKKKKAGERGGRPPPKKTA